MCLLVFSLQQHPDYPLIFAGNRDEFHGRPTAAAGFWDDAPDVLAGRDLRAGGTWLGVSQTGRFATVTNFREPGEQRPDLRSRGELVSDFLRSDAPAGPYLERVHARAEAYNGFNLILGTAAGLHYLSNRNLAPGVLEPGLYGLSNGRLDTPWPKVRRAKALLAGLVEARKTGPDDLLDLLRDESRPPDTELPKTGLDLEIERKASAIFISDPVYGTRASTVVRVHGSGTIDFVERTFGPKGEEEGTTSFSLQI